MRSGVTSWKFTSILCICSERILRLSVKWCAVYCAGRKVLVGLAWRAGPAGLTLPWSGLKLRPKTPARGTSCSASGEVCALAECQGLSVLQLTYEFTFWSVRAPVMFYGVFSFFQNICCHVVLGCSGL